jgi:hypothetical protein
MHEVYDVGGVLALLLLLEVEEEEDMQDLAADPDEQVADGGQHEELLED